MQAAIAATVTVDIAALVSALVLPVVILVLALAYRAAIRDLAKAALGRGFKLGLPGGWSFELPGAREASLDWVSGKAEIDLRRPLPFTAITDSARIDFSEQLKDTTPAEYARVDLGSGTGWLTSRLYFMSIALRRLRGLNAFVFVASLRGVDHGYVGWANLDDVRWALADRYPRLERAFLEASHELAQSSEVALGRGEMLSIPSRGRPSRGGQRDPAAPADLLREFLDRVQLRKLPPTEKAEAWVALADESPPGRQKPTTNEYGQWLNVALLQDVLGSKLVTASIRENELLAKPEAEQARLVAAHDGRYVATTRDDGRFSRLIDREAMMRGLAMASLRQ